MSDVGPQRSLARFARLLAEMNGEGSLAARLCEASRRMLDSDGVALTLDYLRQGRLTLYASNDLAASLEDLQEVVGEGPGFDAARSGSIVVGTFGSDDDGQWDALRERLEHGTFHGTIVAIPLGGDGAQVGVMTLHRDPSIESENVEEAGFIGATVGAAIVEHSHDIAARQDGHDAWLHRSKIHQATGMVVAQVGIRPEDAMALLRGQAFARGVTLEVVAQDIIDRKINFRDFTIEGD
jgi:ANTAR domain/GAF domain